jgi:SH3 domain
MEAGSPRRPQRQDTFDIHGTMVTDEQSHLSQMHGDSYPSDEEHSMLEDDSDQDERDGDYADDDDRSSSLSIPNESIDFDLVYSLHSFAATVEGQASVVKGDSLVLMDDSNSYWWLVRVLKTQEIGYIPAENIETPFERLARLNKHRNVDVRPFRYLYLFANNSCYSWLRLRKRRCKTPSKNLATTSASPSLPAPISRPLPPLLAMMRVPFPTPGCMDGVPSFSLLLCKFTVTLPPSGETTKK